MAKIKKGKHWWVLRCLTDLFWLLRFAVEILCWPFYLNCMCFHEDYAYNWATCFLKVNFSFKKWNIEEIWSSNILLLFWCDRNVYSFSNGISIISFPYILPFFLLLFYWHSLVKIARLQWESQWKEHCTISDHNTFYIKGW